MSLKKASGLFQIFNYLLYIYRLQTTVYFSPMITTGANPQAPTHRRQSNENFPSGVVSPTSIPKTRLNSSNNFLSHVHSKQFPYKRR